MVIMQETTTVKTKVDIIEMFNYIQKLQKHYPNRVEKKEGG